MKFKLKNAIAVFLILISMLCLSACVTKTQPEIDENKVQMLEQTTERFLGSIITLSDEEIQMNIVGLEESGNTVLVSGLKDWQSVKDDLGPDISVAKSGFKIRKDKKNHIVDAKIYGNKRDAVVTIGYDEKLTDITTMSFNVKYTMVEKLQKAALNTLIGMGTVFVILIIISLIIYSLKFINIFENRAKIQKADETKETDEIKEDISLEIANDDEELIAVISAAIAAYESENSSSETDLIVRSIRRVVRRK